MELRSRAVAYLRVSTDRQAASGLGLEAQRAAVDAFCHDRGAHKIEEFVEIESGRVKARPVLEFAIERARGSGATLVIARLDRLARNVAFIANLLESGVEFTACDVPSANRLTLHVLAAVAEEEARAISERTKAALAAAKARGVLLGASNPRCRNLPADAAHRGRIAARVARRDRRDEALRRVSTKLLELHAKGFSRRRIAQELNADHRRTSTGNNWTSSTVRNALERVRGHYRSSR
jgi:DNA invertase Pin-like site-specific DNA recombinase